MEMQLSRQDSNFLDDVPGSKLGADLELEEAGEKEGPAEVVDELAYLLVLDRDEALVAALLAVGLFEDDARHSPHLPLLGRDVLPRTRSGDRQYRLRVLRVRPREPVQVLQWHRCRVPRGLPGDGGGRLRERPEMDEGS